MSVARLVAGILVGYLLYAVASMLLVGPVLGNPGPITTVLVLLVTVAAILFVGRWRARSAASLAAASPAATGGER